MANFTVSLLSTRQEAPDVKSFRFGMSGEGLNFQAGQFMRLTLPQVVNDPRGPSRFFSIASSPTEKDFIMIATKISESPFKKILTNLAVGEKVNISGPFGKFTLSEDLPALPAGRQAARQGVTKHHVFLSGGIGITPFRSILKFATDQKLPHKIVLLYSNQAPEDIVFKEDLDQFAKVNPNLTIINTLTRSVDQQMNNNSTLRQTQGPPREFTPRGKQLSNDASWIWETGRIDEAMIKRYVKDLTNAIFYICGPPSMVEGLSGVVKGMEVSEENIKTERFTGYQ